MSDKWWLILDCDPEIGRYLRHLYHLSHHRCAVIRRPAWKEHITVVRDEEPPNKRAWETYDGCSVDFVWDLTVKSDGIYYWIAVECPFALDIREELGLSRNPYHPLHLSIGHHDP